MKKIDIIIKILYNIYSLLKNDRSALVPEYMSYPNEEQMTRQEVKDGTLKPIKMPGGDRFYKRDLLAAFIESKQRGRL